jgi:hypothetical protein
MTMTKFLTFTNIKTSIKHHIFSIDCSNYGLINRFSTQTIKGHKQDNQHININ